MTVGKGDGSHLGESFRKGEATVETGIHEGAGRDDLDVPGDGQVSVESGAFEGAFSDFEEGFREDQFPAQPLAVEEAVMADPLEPIRQFDAFQLAALRKGIGADDFQTRGKPERSAQLLAALKGALADFLESVRQFDRFDSGKEESMFRQGRQIRFPQIHALQPSHLAPYIDEILLGERADNLEMLDVFGVDAPFPEDVLDQGVFRPDGIGPVTGRNNLGRRSGREGLLLGGGFLQSAGNKGLVGVFSRGF